MSSPEKGYNINQTFIIETNEGDGVLSACTGFYTTNIYACTGNTQILLGSTSISTVGDLFVGGDLSATTISATTFYGDGSNLTGISTQDTFITGGTYSNGVATFTNNTGGTFSVSGFSTGYTLTSSAITSTLGYVPLSSYTDTFVTGGTYLTSASTLTFTNNTGGTFSITGITTSTAFTGGTVTGATNFTGGLIATTISATTYQNLPTDIRVTGGTYSDGTATFTNNTGGTFNINGFYTGATDVFVTGATYNHNTFTFTNNTGSTFDVTFDVVTGLTVNGGLTATTLHGDGSNISGINFSQLATTAHTHSISDVINLQTNLDGKIDKPASPFLGDYLYYNGITWVPNQVNIPVAAGAGVTLFLSITGSSLPTYEYLSQFPIELTESQEPVTVNNSQALIGKYATEQLNRTVVDPGIWEFNTYASVDIPSTGLTQIIVTAYLLTTGGSETFLFSASTENITTTAATLYTISVVEPQYSCSTSDYLVVNYSASTTNNFNTVVTLYHGGNINYSHIHTPFVTLHNDLAGLQGGFSNEHYHLSKNEVDLLTTSVDASSIHNHDSSYLSLGGGVVNGNTTIIGSLSANTYLGLPITQDKFVTGFTYNNNTFTISDNSGNTFNSTINSVTGLTITGNLTVNSDLNANTISATTYQNLPIDIFVTGATYNNANQFSFTNNTGGTFNVSFNQVTGLTATTISATTYQNLPSSVDTFVTGFTYSSNTFTLNRNQSLPNLTATINSVTGLTINGSLLSNSISATTISGGTFFGNGSGLTGVSASASITVNSTPILSGTSGRIIYNNGGVFSETLNAYWDNSNTRLGLNTSTPTSPIQLASTSVVSGTTLSNWGNWDVNIGSSPSLTTGGKTALLMGRRSDSSGDAYIQTSTTGTDYGRLFLQYFSVAGSLPTVKGNVIIGDGSDGSNAAKLNVTNGPILTPPVVAGNPNTGGSTYAGGMCYALINPTYPSGIGLDGSYAMWFQSAPTIGTGFKWYHSNSRLMTLNNGGKLGIGETTPTAYLHLAGSSTAANSAPIKINSGSTMTTPESGAIENNGTNLFFTPSSTRNILAQISGSTALTTGQIPFATTNGYLTATSNLFWDNSNNRLNIGTSSPTYSLGNLWIQGNNTSGSLSRNSVVINTAAQTSMSELVLTTNSVNNTITSLRQYGTSSDFPNTIYGINPQGYGHLFSDNTKGVLISTNTNSTFIGMGMGLLNTASNLFFWGGSTGVSIKNGTTTPTAYIHLGAGTATAGTAPIKFTSGTNLTTPEAGAVEYNGTQLFFTPSSSTRNIIAQISGSTALSTGQIPFVVANGYLTSTSGLTYNNTNGRLAIGGIAPNYDFSIMRNAPSTQVGMQISNNGSGTSGSDGLFVGIGSDNNAYVQTYDANGLNLGANTQIALTLTSTNTRFGGILSNVAANTGAVFQVNGNSSTSGLGFFQLRNNAGTPVLCANENGKVFINLSTVGTAQLHIGAGSTAANTAPIKINSGTLMTTPEVGAIEYNNTFHVTNSDATRRHIVTAPNTTKVTAGAPYTNDGYIIVNIGGTDFKLMTTA